VPVLNITGIPSLFFFFRKGEKYISALSYLRSSRERELSRREMMSFSHAETNRAKKERKKLVLFSPIDVFKTLYFFKIKTGSCPCRSLFSVDLRLFIRRLITPTRRRKWRRWLSHPFFLSKFWGNCFFFFLRKARFTVMAKKMIILYKNSFTSNRKYFFQKSSNKQL